MASEDGGGAGHAALVDETRISCCSKRIQEEANEELFSTVDAVIGKNTGWTVDQRDRLRRRFREVYKNALHENSTVDGKSWAEAVDDADTSKECEPVDQKLKGDTEQMAADLDALIVETVSKRKNFPPRLTQQMAKKLRCLHTATEQYKPVIPKSIEDTSPIMPLDDEDRISGRLTASGSQLSTLARLFPDMEDKAERLQETINIHSSLAINQTHNIINRPLRDEATMAASLTPLRARARAEAATPPAGPSDAASKRQRLTAPAHHHPNKRYKARTPNAVNTT